jgi:acyl-CoA thioester hydrolase
VAEPFRFSQRVRYHECDPQGVVFNANYLTYFDVTMTELWRELGGYQAMVDSGVDMVVAEARLRYRAPLRFDDEFEGRVSIARLGETSMTAAIGLVRDEETVVEGQLRYVFIETDGGPKAPIPPSIRAALERYAVAPQPADPAAR